MKTHNESKQETPTTTVHSASTAVKLPYFDDLLALLAQNNKVVNESFGRHVHWGYWPHPTTALPTTADFALAAENLSQQVCRAGHVANNRTVLDVGCGFGGTIAHINDNYTGMTLTGLNLDERQLLRARDTVIAQSDNYIDFQQGDACALPFADQSFDIVLAVECIFHFPDRQQFFAEAYRVLKPGGYLALSDFIPHPAIAPLTKIKLPENLSVGFYGKCNVQYTTRNYQNLARQMGFDLHTEQDITDNTLPTYTYLRWLARQQPVIRSIARLETTALECLSRLKLLNYYIYGLQKPF
ncbi:Methylase involved in ubiquinone/menaquinone biosynthesis [Crenothrix polyspora]|uniref:Methylase involved in ubiquinone/menaquinone biosynthesis n=1 Tax=Crenothrix polyspora TaxID=360316 RepID=A0A1R4H8T7_9GAMM|nr:class I SAM-dependent methyltransferase [Crenothrix polyspora]SJM92587.1 Methylase involved in ubiquinone/menaquinone biosynthesis [Crenothrix polyspora]